MGGFLGGFRSFGARRIFAGNMGEGDEQPRAENSAAAAAIAGIEEPPLRQKALVYWAFEHGMRLADHRG
jgi:hypothetical protein